MIGGRGGVGHHAEVPELARVRVGSLVERAVHHTAQRQRADVAVFVVEHLVAFQRAAYRRAVEDDRIHAVDEGAIELRAVGAVAEGVDGLLAVDRAATCGLEHLRNPGRGFLTHGLDAGIEPKLVVFRRGDHREQRYIGALHVLQQLRGIRGVILHRAIHQLKLRRLVEGRAVRSGHFFVIEARAHDVADAVRVFARRHRDVPYRAVFEHGHGHAEAFVVKAARIAGDTADPEAVVASGDGHVLRHVVGELLRREAAAGHAAQAVAIIPRGDRAGGRAAHDAGHLQAAAHDAGVRGAVRKNDLRLRGAVLDHRAHARAYDATIHSLRRHLAGVGSHFAVHQRHAGDGGAIGVAHYVRAHQRGVHAGVLQREVADLSVVRAAEKPHCPALGLVDRQVADGVALPIERTREGCFHGGDLLLLLALAGGRVGADGRPLDACQVDVSGQNVMAGQVFVDGRELLHSGDFDGRVALRQRHRAHHHHQYQHQTSQSLHGKTSFNFCFDSPMAVNRWPLPALPARRWPHRPARRCRSRSHRPAGRPRHSRPPPSRASTVRRPSHRSRTAPPSCLQGFP